MQRDYSWYDPDKDVVETGGIKGINLANAIITRAGGFEAYFSQGISQEEEYWGGIADELAEKSNKKRKLERKLNPAKHPDSAVILEKFRRPKNPVDYENDPEVLAEIAGATLKTFLRLEMFERHSSKEIKYRLSEMLRAGYPVEIGFWNMDRSKAWACFQRHRLEIEFLAQEKIPEVYEEIMGQRSREDDQAYDLR